LFLQNLDVTDVLAADIVEFPTKNGMIPNDEGNVKIEPIVKVVQTVMS